VLGLSDSSLPVSQQAEIDPSRYFYKIFQNVIVFKLVSAGQQPRCAWQRMQFARSLIGCTIMHAASHASRQRVLRPRRPLGGRPAAVVVSLLTSGSAPQPGRMSKGAVDLVGLAIMIVGAGRGCASCACERGDYSFRGRGSYRTRATAWRLLWPPSRSDHCPGARGTLSDAQAAVSAAAWFRCGYRGFRGRARMFQAKAGIDVTCAGAPPCCLRQCGS